MDWVLYGGQRPVRQEGFGVEGMHRVSSGSHLVGEGRAGVFREQCLGRYEAGSLGTGTTHSLLLRVLRPREWAP